MKRFLILALLPLLAACIVVDDFGDAWENAKGDICLNRISTALYHQVHERDVKEEDIEEYARGITLNDQHYILMKKNTKDKGGFLFRFRVKEGVFTRYKLNPTMRKTFTTEYPDAPVNVGDDTVSITTLDTATTAALTKVALDARYWEEDDRTLYNPMRNAHCRFEDRDLKALEEADKAH